MGDAATNPLLVADSVSFAYGARAALRGVSLDLRAGEVVALIGPNGSGKSTLIKALLGQLAARGAIAWLRRPLRLWPRRALARVVAYLPQSPTAGVDQTVADVLRLGRAPFLSAFGVESARDIEVVREVSALLALDDLMQRRIDELSGGQRQSVFVGRCLVQEPRAMLLDEPNTYLDLKHQIQLSNLLRQLARNRGIGVLMALHDVNLAGALADRLVLLQDGQVMAAGLPGQVLRPDVLSAVYGVRIERLERANGTPLVFPVLDES